LPDVPTAPAGGYVTKAMVFDRPGDKISGSFGRPAGTAMASKIFLNYRREDSIAIAGRLHDRLAEAFGRENLFMDVANIPVGINFEEYLNNQVAQCDAMLSVIGKNWLNAKDETGRRRLDKPDDFVAVEIAAALARNNILVIPVLVDGTHMPKASELPTPLKALALRNAIQVRNTNFGNDAEQLITKLREALALGRPEQTQTPFIDHFLAACLFSIGIFLVGLWFFFSDSNNAAGKLAAWVAALPIIGLGCAELFVRSGDQSARILGLVTTIGGLLAVAAVIVSGQFFQVGLFEGSEFQSAIYGTGTFFVFFVIHFAFRPRDQLIERIGRSWWGQGLFFVIFLGFGLMYSTWIILYRLTDSMATVLAVVGAQLLVAGFCFIRFRYGKTLAAKRAPGVLVAGARPPRGAKST
jgi:hypothetical protein